MEKCNVEMTPPVASQGVSGVPGPADWIYLILPPYLALAVEPVAVGVAVEVCVAAGIVADGVVAAGLVAAGVVETGVVMAGAVGLEAGVVVLEVPQPVMMNAQTNRIAKGTNNCFNLFSSFIFYPIQNSR
jgi:hypothetical protein